MGYDGCGKTYWAKELLKRYHIITIGVNLSNIVKILLNI